MYELIKETNNKVSDEDLKDVDKVTPELIENILKHKIKNGKSDSEFDITTDGLKQAPLEFSEHLAISIKASLIHGHFCQDLLNCAIVPLLKDKNGKLDDSSNYRGIGLSCLILKIYDWIMLILYDEELGSDPNQFGYQAKTSYSILSWTVIELVNAFSRSGSPLLDYRKAFDYVNHVKIFTILRKRKVNLIFLRLMIIIYIKQRCNVKWNKSYSFQVTNGTRQGVVFSPWGGFNT